jgi:periplasmic protein TonB
MPDEVGPNEVKLDPKFHVPEEDPDIHLQRLLAPQDLDEPFYKTITKTVKNLIHPPPPPPPLEITSKPVDPSELKGLNGLYGGNESRAAVSSVVIHVLAVLLLLWIGSLKSVQKAAKEMVTLIAPPPPLKPVENKGGGGGGARQPEVKKADLPKPRKFVQPPTTTPVQTKLELPASLLDFTPTTDPTDIGNLTGLNALNGNGYGGGIGNGKGGGIGNGTGSGVGDGTGGGRGGGVYKPGGDVSNPIPISRPEPQYSEEARKAKWGGTVLLSLVVDETGHTKDIKVLKPLGLGLDEKAIEAVTKWTFIPGKKGGKPVAVAAQIEVTFRLL